MGATEQGFYEIARARGIRLDRQVAVFGLSSGAHEDPVLSSRASPRTLHELEGIFAMLGGDAARLATKRSMPLRLDFYSPELDLFIEVDETQHFSTDRARTLELYRDPGAFWIAEYLRLIEVWKRDADRYRAAKPALDFSRPGGRRAQRAFLDTVRDLAGPELGIRILRIPAPECDPALAYTRFEATLAESPPVQRSVFIAASSARD